MDGVNPIAVAAVALGIALVADEVFAATGVFSGSADSDPADTGSGGSDGVSALATARAAVAAVANPLYRNTGSLPTAEQVAAVNRKWNQRGRRAGPFNFVPRARTALPGIAHQYDLMPFVRAATPIVGSENGAKVLAVLFSIETWAGGKPWGPAIASYNFNSGNVKASRDYSGPVFFLVDRVNSLDAYPSFDTMEGGIRHKLATLSLPRYNRPGTKGALRSMADGDLREFNRALGLGGYANLYRANDAMRGRYRVLLRNRAITPGGILP